MSALSSMSFILVILSVLGLGIWMIFDPLINHRRWAVVAGHALIALSMGLSIMALIAIEAMHAVCVVVS